MSRQSGTPREWYALIAQADHIAEWYPLGLANVWFHINSADYPAARRVLDRVAADIAAGRVQRRETPRRLRPLPEMGCAR